MFAVGVDNSRPTSKVGSLSEEIYSAINSGAANQADVQAKIKDLAVEIANTVGVKPEDINLNTFKVNDERLLSGTIAYRNEAGVPTYATFAIDPRSRDSIYIGRESIDRNFSANNLDIGCNIPCADARRYFKMIGQSMSATSINQGREVPYGIISDENGLHILMGAGAKPFLLPNGRESVPLNPSEQNSFAVFSEKDGVITTEQIDSARRFKEPLRVRNGVPIGGTNEDTRPIYFEATCGDLKFLKCSRVKATFTASKSVDDGDPANPDRVEKISGGEIKVGPPPQQQP